MDTEDAITLSCDDCGARYKLKSHCPSCGSYAQSEADDEMYD